MLAAVDWHILWQRIFHPDHVFVLALWRTIYISVLAQTLGVVLGLIAALMRMSRFFPLRLLSGAYVLIFRGTPLIVQIFFVYFGANLLFGFTLIPRTVDFGVFQMDGAPFAGILAVAFWYLVLTTVWSLIQAQIERKLAVSERGDELTFRERVAAAWLPAAMRIRGTP